MQDEKDPRDFSAEIARLNELASALPKDIQSLDSATPASSAASASTAALFELLNYYESLDSRTAQSDPDIIAIVAHALSNKKLRLADEKAAVQDESKYSVLDRVIRGSYPLSLIHAVLERPEAKRLVRLTSKNESDLITLIRHSQRSEKQWTDQWVQCCRAYLLHIEHPWRELFIQFTKERIDFDDQIINLLLEEIGPFPWHEESSFTVVTKFSDEFFFTLPTAGIHLLSEWLSCKNISVKSLEKFIGNKPIAWPALLQKFQLIVHKTDFLIYEQILKTHSFFDDVGDGTETKEKSKPKSFLSERIAFLLKNRITQVSAHLLDQVQYKKDVLKECLDSLTPQDLCKDPENGVKIIGFLIVNDYPLAQIKTFLPEDSKATASLLNCRIKTDDPSTPDNCLLEGLITSWIIYDKVIQFLLDHGCQVTGRAIRLCHRDYPQKIAQLLGHLRKAGPAWYQEPQQGYELLAAMIEALQPIAEIQYYLELELKKPVSGVLNYTGADGLTFSNLWDSVEHYDAGDRSRLMELLTKRGATITGKAFRFLFRENPSRAMDLLNACDLKQICIKPPRHGAELISGIISALDDPIMQLQPWLESKEEKAFSAMLAYDMSDHSPLSEFINKIRLMTRAQFDFILLLIRKGAIPSGKNLTFLASKMHEPVVPLVLAYLNPQHLWAHSPEEITELLTAMIKFGCGYADLKKLLDFGNPDTVAKVVNNAKSPLLSAILQTWSVETQDITVQLVQLLVDKGYCLDTAGLECLKKIPLAHRQRIWTALAKAPFKPINKYEVNNIAFALIDLQAPIERVQQLPSDGFDPVQLLGKMIDTLNAENGAYRLSIILSLSIDINHYYLHDIGETVIKHYYATQDLAFKKTIAAIWAAVLPFPSFSYLDPNSVKQFLIEAAQFHLITADYFSQAQKILVESVVTWLPTTIINIISKYSLPVQPEKLLLDSAQRSYGAHPDLDDHLFFISLPVTPQSELGLCSAHAATNAQLMRAMRRQGPVQLLGLFAEDMKKDHPCQDAIKFFL